MSSHAPATLSRVEPQTTGHAREERIAALAATQHGIVTREQLMELGLSRSAVGRRLRSGRLRPLHTGVYLMGPIEPDCARGIQVIRLTWRETNPVMEACLSNAIRIVLGKRATSCSGLTRGDRDPNLTRFPSST